MATRFSIEAVFKGIDKFSAPVARMTTRMDRFRRATARGLRGIQRNAKRVLRGMRSMALTMGSLAAAGAIGLRGLLRPAVDFEHAVAGINAKTRGAIKLEGRLNEVRDKALYLGERTIYTSIQVAEAMQELAKAGLSTSEIVGGIEPILHAAGAEGTNIADVSKVILSTMKAFNKELSLENTTHAADVMANVAANAKTSILELGEGVSKFAPVAHMFGFALEDTVAFVAALQDVGIEASMSGTQLKTMFSKLATMNQDAKKQFKSLGIDVREALELGDAPRVVREIMQGLERATSKEQKVAAMTAAFGQRGMIAAMLLAMSEGKKSGGLLDLLKAAGPGATGAAEEMYNIAQDTTKGAFTELSSAWETFRIKVGTGQLPEMKKLADSIADILRDPKAIEKVAGLLNDASSGIKTFWNTNKELLQSIWSAASGFAKLVMQLIGGFMVLTTPLRALLGWMFNIVSMLFNALSEFSNLLNNTAFGKLVNKWLASFQEEPGMGVQVNKVDTTRVTHGNEQLDVVNPHGIIYIKSDPGTKLELGGTIPMQQVPVGAFVPFRGAYGYE